MYNNHGIPIAKHTPPGLNTPDKFVVSTAATMNSRHINRQSPNTWFVQLLAAVLALSVGRIVVAQETNGGTATQEDQWYLGYAGFRMLLEERGLTVRRDLDHTLSTPDESVVVMFGDQSTVPRSEWLRLRRYVAQGGTLLVASEKSFTLPGVSTFTAGPATARTADRYQNFADCVRLTSLNSDHPLASALSEIIVNRTGWLSKPEDDSLEWEVVASLPHDCSPAAARGQAVLLAGLDPDPIRGVLILSADQSLFSDGMLWHGDNAILAIQTSDLLCRGNRRWLTVIDSKQTLPSYQSTPPVLPPPQVQAQHPQLPQNIEPPEPELATMLKMANLAIDKVQESNILNEALKERPRNVRPIAWLRTMLLVLLILATAVLLWKLIRKRSLTFPVQHRRFMESMYGVHSAKQLQSSEFGSAVEVLARDLCREITGSQVETDWLMLLSDSNGTAMTRLPRSLRKGLTELLGIATKGCRIHISRRKFQTIGRTIQELRMIQRTRPILTSATSVVMD